MADSGFRNCGCTKRLNTYIDVQSFKFHLGTKTPSYLLRLLGAFLNAKSDFIYFISNLRRVEWVLEHSEFGYRSAPENINTEAK